MSPRIGKLLTMNSYKTAISRKSLPVPVRYLLGQGMVHGHVLDYGCGKCKPINDAVLTQVPGVKTVTSFDPHWEPTACMIPHHYDVVLCTYVLCTLPQSDEQDILWKIKLALRPNGIAYVSVRNDEPKQGYGVSNKGTFQRKVVLDYLYELKKCHQYRIYLLTSASRTP